MLLLAFDTATPAITVAVHDGADIVGEAEARGAMAHGELLAAQIRRALESAGASMRDVTDIAVGVGPGPFTGLRVGVVTALTLGQTLGARTHGVCSLDILAAEVVEPAEFVVATDARRKEVYWARYREGRRLFGPAVDRPATVAEQGLPVVGRGAELYSEVLTLAHGPLDPSAAALARLVAAGSAETLPLEPLYLRRPDATPQPSTA
ncbi:tRNA (adenosine(37)-N6)-threonylcarbamoyltransferase complex dimerization subunit type 1 TsaB [Aeromicrobium phragmitis]|uniref:tRNA (Adenosine(37)-N6)-threonylcarbamoyltransferase complex dimerization subunit type 1 TsaB n=1 Tax=Aeromicrobium phragmitis TaxID=2478914 RepID=A0A3L8PNZ9_9ACTN|nr:tRNA (adenosine(37)-N6)-threonylcarbamoyltransferase complex dimerization subunit type 1 TsaB [Aeromicrobium phragmitis]RLV56539.1 tRNA (adenosine(37)-N6)-threonylcarbamoyltransferase complex dimerization subunit type 1 TsaB [Aeromicrobium phragmitis]